MKFSIITTSYNAEKYIEETLESVLYQRGNFEIEYIIIDANSSDKTFEIIQKYKKLVDEGFFAGRTNNISMQIYQESDFGMYDGISKGFQKATGDIIAYINADDFYLPNAFSCVCNVFEHNKNVNWITGLQNVYNPFGHNILRYNNMICQEKILTGFYGLLASHIQQESVFFKRELLNLIDIDEFKKYKYAGDFYLWHTFAKTENLYTVDSLLSGFRYHLEQKSTNTEAYNTEFIKIIGENNVEKEKFFSLEIFKMHTIPIIKFDTTTQKWEIRKKNKFIYLLFLNRKITELKHDKNLSGKFLRFYLLIIKLILNTLNNF